MELTRDTLNNYFYLTNDLHYPIAIVKADKNNAVKSVEYYMMFGYAEQNEVAKEQNTIKVYPNPAQDEFTIEFDQKTELTQYTVQIMDVFGHVAYTAVETQTNVKIDCSSMKPGIYFYSVITGGDRQNGKIVIQ